MINCWNSSIDSPSLEREVDCQNANSKRFPPNATAGSHLPVVPEKLISSQSTHTEAKYQYTGQSLTKGTDTKVHYKTYY